MKLDEKEKAALDQEWKKMGGMGRRLSRQRTIATLVSIAVAFPFFVVAFVGLAFGGFRALLFMVPGIMLGAFVRKSMWPKGQFD